MTKKHYLFFLIWKIKMYLKGYKKGTFVKVWSEEKNKFIKGVVLSLSGDSVTKKNFGFDVNVKFLEPVVGHDSRFYSYGSYSSKEIGKKLLKW